MKQKLVILSVLSGLLMAGVFLLLSVPSIQALPTTSIMVTTTSDVIANDGQCALREAIIAANTDSAVNDCPAGSGADAISFDPSLALPAVFTLNISGAGEDQSASGDLDILGTLIITGSGAENIIIDGNGVDRVLDIRPGAKATISGVTVRNGNLTSSLEGGGIRVQASLTLSDTILTNNHGGGLFNNGGGVSLANVIVNNSSGGYGVQNLNLAVLTFNGGQVSDNQNGGISNATATASLNNLIVTGNLGSGIANSGATLSHVSISQSTITNNAATNGGGVFNSGVGAITDIVDSTISGNSAALSGGGIYNNGSMTINSSTLDHNHATSGGGIDHSGSSLQMTNVTISSNSVSDNGGGFYNRGSATLTHVTFSSNTSSGIGTGGNIYNDEALLTLQNSLVANSDADGNCFYSGGFVTSSGNNLDDGNTCAFSNAGDQVNMDPLLGPLQNNGGPTLTHALLPGSPAIDQGNSSFCPALDQRGEIRPAGACDIGAYELVGTVSDNTYLYLPIVLGG